MKVDNFTENVLQWSNHESGSSLMTITDRITRVVRRRVQYNQTTAAMEDYMTLSLVRLQVQRQNFVSLVITAYFCHNCL